MRDKPRRKLWLLFALTIFLGPPAAFGGWYWWVTRPPATPPPLQETLLPGVVHIREIRKDPRPLVLHFIRIDLRTPGLEFIVTPGDPRQKLPFKARTTTQFCREFGASIAINGDFFEPWHSTGLFDYYPHVGDRVRTYGISASRGVMHNKWDPQAWTLYLSRDNLATFHKPHGAVYNAISGNAMLVEKGVPYSSLGWYKDQKDLHPRCAVGIDKSGAMLWLALVDGRQQGYSEGCLLYTSPSPRDGLLSRMPSSA